MTEDIFKYINLSRIATYHVPTLITPTIEYVWVVWEDSIYVGTFLLVFASETEILQFFEGFIVRLDFVEPSFDL